MQITTATRTVEIYANTEAGITYRNVKDGKATGPVRTADRATAKAGSVGREILDAIDAQVAAEVEVAETVEIVAEVAPVATETVAPRMTGFERNQLAAQIATETVEITEGTEVRVGGQQGRVTRVVPAGQSRTGRAWAAVTWTTTEAGAPGLSYGFAWLDQVTVVSAGSAQRAARIRKAVNLKW